MKNSKKIITLIVIAIVILGVLYFLGRALKDFGPGNADYRYRIAEDCILNSSSAHEGSLSCNGFDKGVDSEIYHIGWDKNYLIAITHPVTKTAPGNPNCLNCYPDESITYWWILDFNHKINYGPYNSEQEFSNKKDELKVGDIVLTSVELAKKKGVPDNQ